MVASRDMWTGPAQIRRFILSNALTHFYEKSRVQCMSWNNNNKIIRRHDSSRTEPMSFMWHGKQTRERKEREKKTHTNVSSSFVRFGLVWLAASLKDFCRIFSVRMYEDTKTLYDIFIGPVLFLMLYNQIYSDFNFKREEKKWWKRQKGTTKNRQHRKDEKEKRLFDNFVEVRFWALPLFTLREDFNMVKCVSSTH